MRVMFPRFFAFAGWAMIVCCTLPGMALGQRAQDKVLFLIVEPNRLVASNTALGRFDELKLNAKEIIEQRIEAEAVIVIVTNQRYVAYGAYAPGWQSLRVRANEKLITVEAKDAAASIVTSDRYMNFNGRVGQWTTRKRRL